MTVEPTNIMTGTPGAGVTGLGGGPVNAASISANDVGVAEPRRDFDWGDIGKIFAKFFQKLIERFSDRDRDEPTEPDSPSPSQTSPLATAPDGQQLPVATLTREDLNNTSFTGLSIYEEAGALKILSMIGDGSANGNEREQIASILENYPKLATLQVDSEIPMFNRPPMSIENFIALDKPWFAGGGKVVNNAEERASIGNMLEKARADLARQSPETAVAEAQPPAPRTARSLAERLAARGESNLLYTYFSELESRIQEGEVAPVNGIAAGLNNISANTDLGDGTPKKITGEELATAERNISAAFDTDGVAGLSKKELGDMQDYVKGQGEKMDTAEELLGHFSAPTFNIAAAREQNGAGVSV